MSAYPEGYLGFLRLYRRHEYFESHDELETYWIENRNDFYKGLIQVAVAQLQLQRANLIGAAKMFQRSERCLRPYAPKYMGLDVTAVLKAIEQRKQQVEALRMVHGDRAPAPVVLGHIQLPLDPDVPV